MLKVLSMDKGSKHAVHKYIEILVERKKRNFKCTTINL